ncbi:MAG: ABC transporter ATP-binding protein [Candidatus Bathyarchaeota archaeon]|nr:MAG: ABC transporter ATP-binding protein [Candidatus Bathyarchaeota archaeon]
MTCISIFNIIPPEEGVRPASLDSKSPSNIESRILESHDLAIEVDNVVKKYVLGPVVVHALTGLSMKIKKGEFIAIMGPSGSGKSTLLNLIGALDRPSSGGVLIDGINLASLDDTGLAKLRNEKIGFVFQAYNLIARSSVIRNMELPALVQGYSKVERDQRIAKLLTIVGLPDKAHRKPKTMSGGEQQRVGIARALMNNPSIILADEPTGNIDSKTGSEIMRFLRQMNMEQRVTVVMVTHDREVAELTDRIIYLRDGKITEELGGNGYEDHA